MACLLTHTSFSPRRPTSSLALAGKTFSCSSWPCFCVCQYTNASLLHIAQRQVVQLHLQHATQCISVCSTRQHWKRHAERSARLGVCRLTVQWPPGAVPLCVTEGERALGHPLLVLWSSHEPGELRFLSGAKTTISKWFSKQFVGPLWWWWWCMCIYLSWWWWWCWQDYKEVADSFPSGLFDAPSACASPAAAAATKRKQAAEHERQFALHAIRRVWWRRWRRWSLAPYIWNFNDLSLKMNNTLYLVVILHFFNISLQRNYFSLNEYLEKFKKTTTTRSTVQPQNFFTTLEEIND